MTKKPNKCDTCNSKHFRLYLDKDQNKWICGKCWKKTHDFNQVTANWSALGIAH